MNISKVHSLFFSATFSTKKIITEIVRSIRTDYIEHDITETSDDSAIDLGKDDLLVIGVPVYSGRVPEAAVKGINRIRGNNTLSIIVCVYGNREYDDALLELKDMVCAKGCIPIAAAALVAEHSIFPQIAANRPDESDFHKIKQFCNTIIEMIKSSDKSDFSSNLHVKGNTPYRPVKTIPIHPSGSRLCNKCGLCAKWCPVQAIDSAAPRKTDKDKCISCGRCIVICPKKARSFQGILYSLAKSKFIKNYSARKEPDFFFIAKY